MIRCRWVASDQPRIIVGHHGMDCPGDECRGCLPCGQSHCRVCGIAHHDHTCPECLAETRETLHEIARMCDALPEEVEARGIDSEAMTLLGPACDWEARGHLEASVAAGRLPGDWIEVANDERHPMLVATSWASVWREHLEHEEPSGRARLPDEIDYLDRQLTYMATQLPPFEDFAHNLRQCRSHLERVLHDGEQRDTGAPCMQCQISLVREWGVDEAHDGWRCPRCRRWHSEDQYRFAVMHLHREEADWLTDREMQLRTGVRAGTVREWARRALVGKRRDQGRVVYSCDDVERVGREKGMMTA